MANTTLSASSRRPLRRWISVAPSLVSERSDASSRIHSSRGLPADCAALFSTDCT